MKERGFKISPGFVTQVAAKAEYVSSLCIVILNVESCVKIEETCCTNVHSSARSFFANHTKMWQAVHDG